MNERGLSSNNPNVAGETPATSSAPDASQSQRHEVEPTVQYALTPGPGRDTFLFYHVDATVQDGPGLWEYCRFCVSHLVWVNDHYVVTPNPCYLNPASELNERFAKIKRVLLNWYSAKRLVRDLEATLS